MRRRNLVSILLVIAAGALFFIPFLGAVHLFDWDEINFAESAREMIVTGNYAKVQIDYQPFWEKPPLFFWLQSMSMHLFGINEFAARFPNALFGIITLVTFFIIGKNNFDERFGFLWVLCMIGSFLPHLYFKSGIIDPVFNYFIFLGIYFIIVLVSKYGQNKIGKYAALAGILVGLGILTKGPVALLITFLTGGAYWLTVRLRPIISFKHLLVFTLFCFITAGLWFAIDVKENGIGFVKQFIDYQIDLLTEPVAGHGGPIYYHFVVVFIGCFPMSIVALPALFSSYRETTPNDFKRWMVILFWVVMILFTIVKTKIVHYSSLTYFPLSFLAAYVIYKSWGLKRLKLWLIVLLGIIGSIFAILLFAAPWLAEHKDLIIPYIKDPFAIDCLDTGVSWKGFEPFIGLGYWLLIVIAVMLLSKGKLKNGIAVFFGSTAICLLVYLKAVVPKIESYSQLPAIEFYQSLKGQRVYVIPVGFKSYAQYFYFEKPPSDNGHSITEESLLRDKLDRPAYFVVKTTSMDQMKQYPGVQFLYRKGGFAFYERTPSP